MISFPFWISFFFFIFSLVSFCGFSVHQATLWDRIVQTPYDADFSVTLEKKLKTKSWRRALSIFMTHDVLNLWIQKTNSKARWSILHIESGCSTNRRIAEAICRIRIMVSLRFPSHLIVISPVKKPTRCKRKEGCWKKKCRKVRSSIGLSMSDCGAVVDSARRQPPVRRRDSDSDPSCDFS